MVVVDAVEDVGVVVALLLGAVVLVVVVVAFVVVVEVDRRPWSTWWRWSTSAWRAALVSG